MAGSDDESDTGREDAASGDDEPTEAGAEAAGGSERSAFEGGAEPDQRRVERLTNYGIAAVAVLLVAGVLVGLVSPTYLLYLVSLAGMYALLSLGLNVQWGYAGLINFSVAAFFGLGAYVPALLSASGSPLPWDVSPIAGLFVAVVLTVVLALAIGIPTLSLREDYLAIASLGLAEVVRLVLLNEREWTAGSRGISGVPVPLSGLPLGTRTTALLIGAVMLGLVYLFVRRIHRSPWGRVQRTIRADEDLAEALGKDSYRMKMQAFVIGSVVMALSGVLWVYHAQFLGPGDLLPLETFYVWVALILGGTGSDRGALLGGLVIVTIREGTRFVSGTTAYGLLTDGLAFVGIFPNINTSSMRLLLVGVLIVLVIRYRSEGLLPPREELIWPEGLKRSDRDTGGRREAHAGGSGAVSGGDDR